MVSDAGRSSSQGGSSTNPPVAVVIPVLNGEDHLGETLDALLAQSYPVAEVIVVDDGCTDDSIRRALERPGVQVVRNPGKGVDSARRFGLSHTSAPLVALLDHDDVWHPDHLRLLTAALTARPDTSAAVSFYQPFADGSVLRFGQPRMHVVSADPWSCFPGSVTATPSSVLVRREALDSVGGWHPGGLGAAGDLYMWLRLTEWGPLVVNKFASVGYRIRAQSMSALPTAEAALRYVDELATAAEKATQDRETVFPGEGPQLARRRLVAHAVRHLAAGALTGDEREVQLGADLLERGTTGDPDSSAQAALDAVVWATKSRGSGAPTHGDAWRSMIMHWPAAARGTAPLRLYHGGLRAILAAAILHPHHRWRWRWLREAAWYRWRQSLAVRSGARESARAVRATHALR